MGSDGQAKRDDAEPLHRRRPQAPSLWGSSDIHSPRYLRGFLSSLPRGGQACLFLLAGDIVDRGRTEAAVPVVRAVREAYPGASIVAVFGNEEYQEIEEELRRLTPEVDWLDDEVKVYECGSARVAVVGTRGALERPTSWQKRHMPWLERVYRERPRIVAGLLREARREADIVVLLSHYALSRATIVGEPRRVWPYLYSPLMERVLVSERPNAAVHGHAHHGTPKAVVAGVPVYNVAFPLNRGPVRVAPRLALSLF